MSLHARSRARRKIRRRSKQLTTRERLLFEGILRGLTITEAAREAGYSQKWPGQAGHQALENIKTKTPSLFDRHGLDDDTFIEKHIKPALLATEKKAALIDGRFVYSKPMAAWAQRIRTMELVARMKGMTVEKPDQEQPEIKAIVINAAHRPPRQIPELATTNPVLSMGEASTKTSTSAAHNDEERLSGVQEELPRFNRTITPVG